MLPPGPPQRRSDHFLFVVHLGRLDEKAAHQLAPFLEIGRLAEIHHVVFDRFPVHHQRVTLRLLDAAVQFHAMATLGAQKKRLVAAAERVGGPKNAHALAYHLGREEAVDWLLLEGGDIAPLAGWEIPTFPLKGGAIVARGVTAGPEVARILLMIEAHWVAEGFPDEARVQELLDEALGQEPEE